jgi:hypothetical protein
VAGADATPRLAMSISSARRDSEHGVAIGGGQAAGSLPPRRTASFPIAALRAPPGKPYFHIYDMGFRMKTTLSIDDTVMPSLSAKLHVKVARCPNSSRLRCACCSPLNQSGGKSPRYQSSTAAERWSMLPTATPCTTPWKVASACPRHQCVGSRRRCRLAISYRMPRWIRTPTGPTGCLLHSLGDPLRVYPRDTHGRVNATAMERTGGVGGGRDTALHASGALHTKITS